MFWRIMAFSGWIACLVFGLLLTRTMHDEFQMPRLYLHSGLWYLIGLLGGGMCAGGMMLASRESPIWRVLAFCGWGVFWLYASGEQLHHPVAFVIFTSIPLSVGLLCGWIGASCDARKQSP